MRFLTSIFVATTFAMSLPLAQVRSAPHVHLAGDSTMADKPTDPPNPEHGWGQLLPKFFMNPAMIVNHAANGEAHAAFISEGRWQKLVDALQPGDLGDHPICTQ
jgi:lysophospholipase L1-like esterase